LPDYNATAGEPKEEECYGRQTWLGGQVL
jgi:hypothetical protein